MGQTYCQTCCADKQTEIHNIMLMDSTQLNIDEPKSSFAKSVRQYIDIHPRVKQVFLQQRNQHIPDRKGIKLQLYYLFQYAAYYEGEWKRGLPHGYGRLIYDDGSVYQGCFKEGTAECRQALFIKEDGSYYKGEVSANKANGFGIFESNTLYYQGQWLNDYPHGEGREEYSKNSYYYGHFKKGKKNGQGKYLWNKNQYFEGEFQDDKIHGWGKYITSQYEYRGEFKQGAKTGKGTMKNLLKNWQYKGQFLDNKFHGEGVFEWEDGTKFTGMFQNNEKKNGKLTLANGQVIDDGIL